jgi:hypothetical protein
MRLTASVSQATNYDPDKKIAGSPDELRSALSQSSQFAAIAGALDFSTYFPRSMEIVDRQRGLFQAGEKLIYVVAGGLIGVFIYCLETSQLRLLVLGMILAIFGLAGARRLMWPWLHAKTDEHCKFIELAAFNVRPPVVYLRRFNDENPGLPTVKTRPNGRPIYSSAPPVEYLENIVETLLHTFGPVVGLGRPGDQTIEHRIFRLYINHDRWQEAVSYLLRHASAVFLKYDESASLDWELAQTIACAAGLIFILVPTVSETAAAEKEAALRALPPPLRYSARAFDFVPHQTQAYVGGGPALLMVRDEAGGRIYGTQLHFKALWDLVFKEMVRNATLADRRYPKREVPKAYRQMMVRLSSRDPHPIRSLLLALAVLSLSGWAIWSALQHFQVAL